MELFIGLVTDDFHEGSWTDQEIGYACQRGVTRIFVKLGRCNPSGMVAKEQALVADWSNAADRIIDHLVQLEVLE